MNPNKLLTVHATARLLGVCEKTVRRRIAAGRLPTLRIGRAIRLLREDVLRQSARKEGR